MTYDSDVFSTPQAGGFDSDVFTRKGAGLGVAEIPGTPKQPEPKTFGTAEKAKGYVETLRYLMNMGLSAPLTVPILAAREFTGNKQLGSRALEKLVPSPTTEAGQESAGAANKVLQGMAPMVGLTAENAAITQLAGPSLKQVKSSITPNIDPEVARLARKAIEYDIPLRPDMLSKHNLPKVLGTTLEQDIPLAGSKVGARQEAYTRALIRQIDPASTATKATPDAFVSAMEKRGKQIGDIAARTPLVVDDSLKTRFNKAVYDASAYGSDVNTLASRRVGDFMSLVNERGYIDGNRFKDWNTKMLQDMRNGNDVVRGVLGDIQNAAMDAFEASMRPKDLAMWKDARKGYAVGSSLIPAFGSASNSAGDLSPAAVSAAVLSGRRGKEMMAKGQLGDVGDLVKIGNQFLKDPSVKNIPERTVAYTVLGGLPISTVMTGNPAGAAVAGGIYGTANIYNRLGPRITKAMVGAGEPASLPLNTYGSQINAMILGDLLEKYRKNQ